MYNKPEDILFQLIRSLEKAEKRHFKLYIKRSSSNENLKIIQLFDAIDKLKTYNENELLKKLPQMQKGQLHNLKKHLYKQILSSLRLLKSADSMDLQLNELFDHAHILYKKGLFYQSLRILKKAKESAMANQKFYYLSLVLALEKRIESQYITKHIQEHAEALCEASEQVSRQINLSTRLSNLSLQLYSRYIKQGPVCTKTDAAALQQLVRQRLANLHEKPFGPYEQLYLFQSLTWYALLRSDGLMGYRYAHKWVQLFEANPTMKRLETSHYIRGLHYLLVMHFELPNSAGFKKTLAAFEAYAQTQRVQENDNFRVQSLLYLAQAHMNQHLMEGTFRKGFALATTIEAQLLENALFIDQHRLLVWNYRMALFSFIAGHYATSIGYAQKIMNDATELRYDLQGNTRLLHLLAHFEEGNGELLAYLTRSTQRFLSRNGSLTLLEKEVLRLLNASSSVSKAEWKEQLALLLQQHGQKEKETFRPSTDNYLLLWAESKVANKPLAQVLRDKFRNRAAV